MLLLLTLVATLCVGSKLILYLRQRIIRLKKEIFDTYQQEIQSTYPMQKWDSQIQVIPDDVFHFMAEQVNYYPPVLQLVKKNTPVRKTVDPMTIYGSKICLN